MSWTDHFPVLEDSADFSSHGPAQTWSTEVFSVEQSEGESGRCHVVSTAVSWQLAARAQDCFPNAARVMELLRGTAYGPMASIEKWLVHLGQAVRALRLRQEPVGMRVYLAPELKSWARAIAEAGGEAVVMTDNAFPASPGMWRLLALEENRLVTVLGPHRLREACRMAELTERMNQAGLCLWRVPGYGTARTRDMTDYRPILSDGLGSTGGLPIRRLLRDLDTAVRAGGIRPECRTSGGRTRGLGGTQWPQEGYDEWFLMAAIYPRVAQGGILTAVEGQRLSPTLLALDIEYATWANPAATVIAPQMGLDWPATRMTMASSRPGTVPAGPILRIESCPVIKTAGLTARHPLPAHAWRDEGIAGMTVDAGVVAHFNPASIQWRGHRWLAYRTECLPMWKWGRVSLARMGDDGRIIEGSNRLLTLPTSFDEWCAEDPRLFIHQDRLYLYYTDHWTGGLAEINESAEVVSTTLFPAETEAGRQTRSRHDKNWGFFEADCKLYGVYWTHPHIVREVDLAAGQFGREWRTEWEMPEGPCGPLHGGSSPVEHDGLMWRIVHHQENAGPPTRERCYTLWLMAFETTPPFRPRLFCRRPIIKGQRMPEAPLAGWRDWLVVFCASLERTATGWRFFFGHNDRRMRWGVISDEVIVPLLLSISDTPLVL